MTMTSFGPHGRRPGPRGPGFKSYTSPEAVAHATETDQLRKLIEEEFGFTPEKIAPTSDGKGHLRLNFDQFKKVLDDVFGPGWSYDDPNSGDLDARS